MTVLLLFSSSRSFSTGSGQRTGMARAEAWFCAQTHFCVVFEVCGWIIVRLEDPNMAHYKISISQSLIIFNLLVFDRIHDATYLSKMSRTSRRNIGPQHQKYSSIFHCTHGYFVSLCSPNPLVSAKKQIVLFHLAIEASPIWSLHLCLTTWICWSLFWDEQGSFFLKPCQTCGDVGAVRFFFFLGFSDPDWTPTTNLWSSSLLFCTSEIYSVFSHWDRWLIWNLVFDFPPIYISVKQEAWLDNFMFIITPECSKSWICDESEYERNILQRYFTHKNSRGANNCVQHVFEKNIYFIMIFPPIFKFL